MSEDKAKRSVPEWLKAAGSSAFGLISGALLMYLTPLVNNAVKPPEPVANFGYQAQGLSVTFQNRSTNATDGWWDFGDGSPLEQYSAQQATITHTYIRPGPYSVRLSLTNLFNEKSERTVTVNLDGGAAAAPVIEEFVVTPKSPSMTVPAVFHLVARVKNADQVIWCSGENRPLDVSSETSGVLQKWVTIDDPGVHTFRVVAVGAKQTVEKRSAPLRVNPAAGGDVPLATVTVAYEAARVERLDKTIAVPLRWNPECHEHLCPVTIEWLPPLGYEVARVELAGNGKQSQVRGVPTATVAPDHSKVIVSAELIRPASLIAKFASVTHTLPLKVTLEKRSPRTTRAWHVPMCLKVPGDTVIPLPAPDGSWQAMRRQVTLDVNEGPRKIWSGNDMPVNRPMQLQGHTVFVSAAVQGNEVVLTVREPRPGLAPAGN